MGPCEVSGVRIFAYLDGELRGAELVEFESHLAACAGCQGALANRRAFLAEVQSARPLYLAPDGLRSRIERIVTEAQVRRSFGERIQTSFGGLMAALAGFRWTTPQAAFALVLLLAVVSGTWLERRTGEHPSSPFAAAALQAHQDRLRGLFPVSLHSTSPQAISAWFEGKVPFRVKLPETEDLPAQQQPYQIEGAGLVSFKGGQLGYVAYRVGSKPVSLLVAPASEVTLAGQRQVAMKSLVIHYDSAGGFHIVTWAVPRKGVTYALVSETTQHANQSCIVCHAGPKDRDFMRGLLSQ